jgi:hypothetical protein
MGLRMMRTDQLLSSLTDDPLPPGLEAIEPEVMARLRHRLEARMAWRSLAMAGLIALAIGAGSGLSPQTSAHAAQALLAVPSGAPSNLLPR